jgi:multiple sugar transport system ATP-binding protein
MNVSNNGNAPTLVLPVVMTESLGSDMLVHLDLDAPPSREADEAAAGPGGVAAGHTVITARIEPAAVAVPGRSLALLLDPARLHFFDRETELAIRD